MFRVLVSWLVACLALGAPVGPAGAADKAAAPKAFEASGSLVVGHPGDLAEGRNVTRQLFLESCSIPPSQGTDGFVIAVPRRVAAGHSDIRLTGESIADAHDLDVHFFTEQCMPMGSISTAERDESGMMPAGTRFVLVSAFAGADISFVFAATRTNG